MSKFNGQLGEYAQKLCYTTSFEEAFLVFEEQIKRLGFDHLVYTFIPRVSLENIQLHQPRFVASETYDKNYLQHYIAERFEREDYAIKMIDQGSVRPLDWWEDIRNRLLTQKERKVLEVARYDYQMKNGLSIPALVGAKGIAGASLISHEDDRVFNVLKQETYEFASASIKLFHNHTMSNSFEFSPFIKPFLDHLSSTERKIVNSLPKGLPVPYIASDVGRSVRYTDNVIRNLRIKMGGVTTQNKPRISTKLLIYYIGLMNLSDE